MDDVQGWSVSCRSGSGDPSSLKPLFIGWCRAVKEVLVSLFGRGEALQQILALCRWDQAMTRHCWQPA